MFRILQGRQLEHDQTCSEEVLTEVSLHNKYLYCTSGYASGTTGGDLTPWGFFNGTVLIIATMLDY